MLEPPLIDEIDSREPELAATLRMTGLPTDDLAEPGRRFFRFRAATGRLIGFIGWELAGEAVLLRSLVVVPAERGQGWSGIMTGWALEQLGTAGVTDVYLLTTTVEGLARKLGFSRIERAQAPPAIQASRQYDSLCPAAAALLHRRLSPSS
ncbi:arsenic resistance N-acetyltransferase ArsN2 [uncultured Thiodictyon sp.]|uniref:arsenic resistance N-acetyltransferase ArsN2 n=1 Tax=uncultured Thiodictyon sp. TaxID=1846217 RepID=UPI0025CDDDE6|nr:arsenic resistance N-acetyltransferase ArsN2 [uncultured Thiodictyon sp.]